MAAKACYKKLMELLQAVEAVATGGRGRLLPAAASIATKGCRPCYKGRPHLLQGAGPRRRRYCERWRRRYCELDALAEMTTEFFLFYFPAGHVDGGSTHLVEVGESVFGAFC
jgi:hypothetical protein